MNVCSLKSASLKGVSMHASCVASSRKDQEEQGQCQVQGALQQVPVHLGHHRQGEGREAEAVPAPRYVLNTTQ